MPIWKEDAARLLEESNKELEEHLRAWSDRLLKLLKDDDWSFVIKTHALIEAAVSQAITEQIGDARLAPVIDRLTFANDATGKLALAKVLGLLDSSARTFVRRLAELRNRLVHDVNQIDFSFEEYISQLSPQETNGWKTSIVWYPTDEKTRTLWHQIALDKPKVAVWMATFMLVSGLLVDTKGVKAQRDARELALKTAEELFLGVD